MTHNTTGIIHDGMTRKGFIAARPYVNPDIRFHYRPMTIVERSRFYTELGEHKADENQQAVACFMLSRYLVSWNLTYPDTHPDEKKRGKPFPCNDADTIFNELDPHVQRLVAAIITGQISSMVDPTDNLTKQTEDSAAQSRTPKEILQKLRDDEADRIKN